MRDDREVNNEIARLTVVLKRHTLRREQRMLIQEQIHVLAMRFTPMQVRDRYRGDDLTAMTEVARWLAGEEDVKRPSGAI